MKTALRAFHVVVILQLFNASVPLANEPESPPPGFTPPPVLVKAVKALVELGYQFAKRGATAAPLANLTAEATEHVANQLKAIANNKSALLNQMQKGGFAFMEKK
jgi:hypothetical protein